VVGVDVAEDAEPVLAGRVEVVVAHLLDLEQLAQPLAQALALLGIVGQPLEQAVGGKDGQAGVVERGQRHQRVAVRALAADLVAVGAGGLVAVMAVGDQQLGAGKLGRHPPRARRGRRFARRGARCRRRR